MKKRMYCGRIECRKRDLLLALPQSSIPPGALFSSGVPRLSPPATPKCGISWSLFKYVLSLWRKRYQNRRYSGVFSSFSCRSRYPFFGLVVEKFHLTRQVLPVYDHKVSAWSRLTAVVQFGKSVTNCHAFPKKKGTFTARFPSRAWRPPCGRSAGRWSVQHQKRNLPSYIRL